MGVTLFILITTGIVYNLLILTIVTMASALNRLPKEYRSMEPGKIFLNLIPFFNFGWFFTSVQAVNASYKKYCIEKQISFVTINFGLGITLGILNIVVLIPFLNFIVFLPWIIVLIIYNVSVSDCKKLTYPFRNK